MSRNVWLYMDNIIQEQLALQVELSLIRHHSFMLAHRLSQCCYVLIVGTGNGLFLSGIASKNPLVRFCGIDSQQDMLDAAKTHDLENLQWFQADALNNPGVSVAG